VKTPEKPCTKPKAVPEVSPGTGNVGYVGYVGYASVAEAWADRLRRFSSGVRN
jgi:hypothetical protein